MTDEERRTLRMDLMRADIELRRKQAAWTGPRTVVCLISAVFALVFVVVVITS